MLSIGKNTSSRDTIIAGITAGAAAFLKATASEYCRPIPSTLFLAATAGVLLGSTLDQETDMSNKIQTTVGLVAVAGTLVMSVAEGDCRHPQRIAVLAPIAVVGFGAYYFLSKWLSGREFWPAPCTGVVGCTVHRRIMQDHTEDGRLVNSSSSS